MAKCVLFLAMTTASFAFLFGKVSDEYGLHLHKLLDMALFAPAVLVGVASWFRVRSYARSWHVVACVLIAVIGLIYAEEIESKRGYLIAGSLAMVLPVASLIVSTRTWWFCAKTFVIAGVASLVVTFWLEFGANGNRLDLVFDRFGDLLSSDGNQVHSNPNRVGGQFGITAVLAFILYLRAETRQLEQRLLGLTACDFYLASTMALSFGCILTASRGAFLAWIAGIGMLLVYGAGHLNVAKVRGLGVMMTLVVMAGLFVTVASGKNPLGEIGDRFSGSGSDTLMTAGSRTQIWSNAYQAWLADSNTTLFGTGTGQAERLLGEYDEMALFDEYGMKYKSPHSVYVEWLLSFGILGAVPGICMLIAMLFQARLLDRQQGIVSRQAFLMTILLFCVTAVLYRHPCWMASGALILAMLSDPLPEPAASTRLQPNGQAATFRSHAAGHWQPRPIGNREPAIPTTMVSEG